MSTFSVATLTLFLSGFLSMQMQAQEANKPLWGKQDVYLATQTEKTFKLVNDILQEKKNLPSSKAPSMERKAALYLLDAVLHDTRLDGSSVIAKFAEDRYEMILDDLKKPLKKGLKIYKLYNDGFIVRSKSVTIAWDIVRGTKMKETPHLLSDEVVRRLVDHCDILFLTHNHSDHVDKAVVNLFVEAGKPVVAPVNVLKNHEKVIHTRSEEIVDKLFTAANGVELQTTILPGHHLSSSLRFLLSTFQGYLTSSNSICNAETRLVSVVSPFHSIRGQMIHQAEGFDWRSVGSRLANRGHAIGESCYVLPRTDATSYWSKMLRLSAVRRSTVARWQECCSTRATV